MVIAPVVRGRKGEYEKLLEQFRLEGYSRVRVDGEIRRLDEEIKLDKKYKHDISVVVDRLVMKTDLRRRLSESIEAAAGSPAASSRSTCSRTARRPRRRGEISTGAKAAGKLPPTSPSGSPSASASPASTAAPRFPSSSRGSSPSTRPTAPASAATGSASSGSSTPSWSSPTRPCRCRRARCSRGAPATRATGSAWSRRSRTPTASTSTRPGRSSSDEGARDLPLRHRRRAPQGQLPNRFGRRRSYSVRFEGIVNNLERRYEETDSDAVRERVEGYMAEQACPDCEGARLRPESLAVKVGGISHRRVHASSRRGRRSSGSRSWS